MDPIFIQIGPLTIRWYGLLLTLAIFLGYHLAERIVKARGHDPEQFSRAAFWAVVAGVVGARAVYVLTSWPEFAADPLRALYVWEGGLSFHGAILGGILAFLSFYWRERTPLWDYLDAAVPGVALGVIAGRIGNLMNGSDTVGRLTSLPIGFTWPEWATGFPGICTATGKLAFGYCPGEVVRGPVHLAQVYGALVGVLLLVASYFWLRAKKPPGYVFWQFVFWYSLLRSVIEEPFRLNPLWVKVYENPELGIGLLTATQLVSIPLILLSGYMLFRYRRQG